MSTSSGSIGSTANEAATGLDRTVSEGAEAVRRDGWLLLEDVMDGDLIDELHAAFNRRHASSGASGQPGGSLRVGHRRYMVTPALKPPFTDPRLYSNPPLLGILTELLGEQRVLVSFSAVVSQPGAEDQHVHRDGGVSSGTRESKRASRPTRSRRSFRSST